MYLSFWSGNILGVLCFLTVHTNLSRFFFISHMVGDKTPDPRLNTYKDVMLNQKLTQEHRALTAELIAKAKAGELKVADTAAPPVKRRRWDQPSQVTDGADATPKDPGSNKWDDATTPLLAPTPGSAATPGSRQWEETPGRPRESATTPGIRQWAETPAYVAAAATPGHDTLAVCLPI